MIRIFRDPENLQTTTKMTKAKIHNHFSKKHQPPKK